MAHDGVESSGKGFELALQGDTIRQRHIATRASNRRRIVVLATGDAEFEGYSIGLDSKSLQLLELSGEVSTIALDHIVSITDGKPFSDLTREERDIVDRRTASFRKTSQAWLVSNWPNVYDKREGDSDHQNEPYRPSRPGLRRTVAEHRARQDYQDREKAHADQEVRDGTSEH